MKEEGTSVQEVGCKDCKPDSAFVTPSELKHRYLAASMFITLIIMTVGFLFAPRLDSEWTSHYPGVITLALIPIAGWITFITLYWHQYIKGAWCTVGTDGMTNINHVHDGNITNFHLTDGRSGIMPVHSTIRCSGWFSRGVRHIVVLEHHESTCYETRVDGEGPRSISLVVPFLMTDRRFPNDILSIGQGVFGTDAALLGLLSNGTTFRDHIKALLRHKQVSRELGITLLQVAILGEYLTAILMRIQNFRPSSRNSQHEKTLRELAEEGLAAAQVGEETLEAWRKGAAETFGGRIIPPPPQDTTNPPPPEGTDAVLHGALGPASDPM